jgi:hypothetical protein
MAELRREVELAKREAAGDLLTTRTSFSPTDADADSFSAYTDYNGSADTVTSALLQGMQLASSCSATHLHSSSTSSSNSRNHSRVRPATAGARIATGNSKHAAHSTSSNTTSSSSSSSTAVPRLNLTAAQQQQHSEQEPGSILQILTRRSEELELQQPLTSMGGKRPGSAQGVRPGSRPGSASGSTHGGHVTYRSENAAALLCQ